MTAVFLCARYFYFINYSHADHNWQSARTASFSTGSTKQAGTNPGSGSLYPKPVIRGQQTQPSVAMPQQGQHNGEKPVRRDGTRH
ncbi:hypothetical protein [uncultured Gimesia sp.]|uniref:hypothetical protein n=1 Tax=uncultured Gimesia sp. TaxID=1678688 RepID=UPI0030D7CDF0